MQQLIVAHLRAEKERSDFKDFVLGSKIVLDRFKEIVYNMRVSTESTKPEDFDKAAWPYYQAFKLGQAQAYKKVEELLTISDNE